MQARESLMTKLARWRFNHFRRTEEPAAESASSPPTGPRSACAFR